MADYNAFPRTATATRGAVYDEGLRAYMNKVYSLMGIGMLVTAATAFGLHELAVGADGKATQIGQAIYYSPLKWVLMFLPLVMVFGFGAALNRLSTQAATLLFYAFAAAMGAVAQLDLPGLYQHLDRADLRRHGRRFRGAVDLWLHDQA